MKILNISTYQNPTLYRNNGVKHHCQFKATPWEDDYDENSVFYHMDKREKMHEIAEIDFSPYRADSGVKIANEAIGKMKISSAKYLGNDCYKGGMTDVTRYVKELKENGIRELIVLCEPSECGIEKACKENDMAFMHVFVPLSMRNYVGNKYFDESFSYGNFISALQSLREGHVFVGCESGNLRTNRFLHVAKLLDPMSKLDLGKSQPESEDYVLAQWIYSGFSCANKEALNYTAEFDKYLKDLLKTYASYYRYRGL